MQTKDLKEQSLKEIASVIRHRFKQEIDFKVAHKKIGDILDHAIQSAIKDREKEIVSRITRHKSTEEIGTREWYKDKLNHVQKVLSELSKKEE